MQEYGEFKGKYVGKIEFENNQSEAFMFKIRPDMAEQYLHLIKGEVVNSASHLGERLLQTLNLLPAPIVQEKIGTEIPHEEVTGPVFDDLPF